MKYLNSYSNFNKLMESNDNILTHFPYIEEILKKYRCTIKSLKCSNDIININFEHPERTEKRDENLYNDFETELNSDNNVKNFSLRHRIGKKEKGVSYYHLVIVIEYGICKNYGPVLQNLFKFIEKYNIKNFEEYLKILTITARDSNKYAKQDTTTDKYKKRAYNIKDWVIKIILKENYFKEIKNHKIHGEDFILIYTKAEHKDSLDGIISFHIPPWRINKFYNYLDTYNLEEESREYAKRDTPIDNKERLMDFFEIANGSMVTDQFISVIKSYFKNK